MANETTRRRKATGRSAATYLGIPHYVFRSKEFGQLTAWEPKLLVEVAGKYNSYNNGNLSCAFSSLKDRGWNSTGTLWKALRGLLEAGWLVTARKWQQEPLRAVCGDLVADRPMRGQAARGIAGEVTEQPMAAKQKRCPLSGHWWPLCGIQSA